MLYNLGEQNSIVSQFLLELRDTKIQKDRVRFRKNMQRLGEIMAYEISKKLSYRKETIETPLQKIDAIALQSQPVLLTILRAGLVYFQGFINYFDQSDCGFIGAYRKENEEEIMINLEYLATPSLTNREVILIDPMLATGRSIIQTIDALMKHGTPSHMHIAVVIAAPEGIKFLEEKIKIPFTLWTCAIDEKLNHQFYIIPGLGDAGDLSFGEKL
ncbi:MAG TPA: uracil phosphoribosyltransferase [Chryseolinea sp.]|nr:uracil phosphoribosyltransferase [Chryseolinea sp.]HPM29745.1 uracil phosphoribosyltransferase [Chryseolinea sp.]